jgi:hypothetical protein
MRVIANHRGARLSGALLLLFFLAVVVLASGWFLARTDRVRLLLADRLSDRLGMKVVIGGSRIGWPYALVLRDVETDGFSAAGVPGFSAGEIRLGRMPRTWDLELRHVVVRVQQDGAGIWKPTVAARLADLRQASAREVTRLTGPVRCRLRLRILDGTFAWLDAEGREEASLRDVRFRMEPVRLPEGRPMTYYHLRIYAASGGALGNVRDLDWAWLTSTELEYIELERAGRFDGGVESDPESGLSEVQDAE